MEAWEIEAREEIRRTIAEYTNRGDFGDADAFAALFTEDAELDIKDGPTHRGHAEIRAMVAGAPLREGSPRGDGTHRRGPLRHHVSSIHIEFESPERARCISYFLVVGPDGPDHWGRYTDELVRAGDRWRFRRRRASVDARAQDAGGSA